MTARRHPLFAVLDMLRGIRMPLGIADYIDAIRAVNLGFGVGEDAFVRLCVMLFAKTAADREVVRSCARSVARQAAAALAREDAADAQPDDVTAPGDDTAPAPDPAPVVPTPVPLQASATPAPPATSRTAMVAAGVRTTAAVGHRLDEVAVVAARMAGRLPAGDYAPVTGRALQQGWRGLRMAVRSGPRVELDATATIQQTARDGILADVILRARRINRAEVTLFVDIAGSMVPFHEFGERLVDTLHGGRLHEVRTYYFHNCPGDVLDTTPAAAGPGKSLARVLDELRSPWARAIVFSDAGAARGRFDRDRVEATREWLDRVRAATPLVWLNPMPTSRWLGTSANAIARSVPMYELSTAGVIQAIRMLRVRESKRAHRDGPRR